MEDLYFVIETDEDGTRVTQYTALGLLDRLNEDAGFMMNRTDVPVLTTLSPAARWDLQAKSGVLIIKGSIVTPKAKAVVMQYTVD